MTVSVPCDRVALLAWPRAAQTTTGGVVGQLDDGVGSLDRVELVTAGRPRLGRKEPRNDHCRL